MNLQKLNNILNTINEDFIDFDIDHLIFNTNKLSKNQANDIYEFLVGFRPCISNNKDYLKSVSYSEIMSYTYELSK